LHVSAAAIPGLTTSLQDGEVKDCTEHCQMSAAERFTVLGVRSHPTGNRRAWSSGGQQASDQAVLEKDEITPPSGCGAVEHVSD